MTYMIKDGMIQETEILGTPFRVDLIPKTNKYARPGITLAPKYITIHNTGNRKRGADAVMHTEYVDNVADYVSWHFTVDDKQIIQEMPINEVAWHAGSHDGNYSSVGIEICEHEGIDWQKAKENAWKLMRYLLNNVKTLVDNPVVPHQKWAGKYCPHRILDEGWYKFLADYKSFSLTLAKPRAVINGKTIAVEIRNGVAYAPVKVVAEALGKKVTWDHSTKTININ